MVRRKALATDRDRPQVQGLSISKTAVFAVVLGEIVQHANQLGVFGAKHAFFYCDRLQVERFGVTPPQVCQTGKVAEHRSDQEVLSAIGVFKNRNGPAEEALGLLVLALKSGYHGQ